MELILITCTHTHTPRRLKRLEHLARKFDHKASLVEAWAADKDPQLLRSDDIDAANLAEVMVSRQREIVHAVCTLLHYRNRLLVIEARV